MELQNGERPPEREGVSDNVVVAAPNGTENEVENKEAKKVKKAKKLKALLRSIMDSDDSDEDDEPEEETAPTATGSESRKRKKKEMIPIQSKIRVPTLERGMTYLKYKLNVQMWKKAMAKWMSKEEMGMTLLTNLPDEDNRGGLKAQAWRQIGAENS